MPVPAGLGGAGGWILEALWWETGAVGDYELGNCIMCVCIGFKRGGFVVMNWGRMEWGVLRG